MGKILVDGKTTDAGGVAEKKLDLPEHLEKEREKEVVFDKYSRAMQLSFGLLLNNMRELTDSDDLFVKEVTTFAGAQVAAFAKNMFVKDEDRKRFYELVKMAADHITDIDEE